MDKNLSLKCVIVTPERSVLAEPADFVVVPMTDGELGIGHDRLPLIGRLGYGELRLKQGARTLHFYVDGGFVQVRDNIVTVLTSRAVAAADIKTDAARDVLRTVKIETTPEGQQAQQKAQQRARVQLRIAKKNKEHSS